MARYDTGYDYGLRGYREGPPRGSAAVPASGAADTIR